MQVITKDKGWVVVTGAYGGMGFRTALGLRREGYRVFALDMAVPDQTHDAGMIPIKTNVTDERSVAEAFDKVLETTSSISAIVHFAGKYFMDSLVEMTTGEFESAFKTNMFGAFIVNRAFLPLLESGSRIIMTTSELAPLDPLPFTGIYAITKGALDRYAYSLAMELQLLGIKVSVLRAGAVATSMLGASTAALEAFGNKTKLYGYNAKRFKAIVDSVEAKSIPPERIARKVLSILKSKRPAFAYSINRNPLLLMLNAMPRRFQLWVIRQVLR